MMNNKIENLINKKRFDNFNLPLNNSIGLFKLVEEYLNKNTIMAEIGNFAGVSSELFALHVGTIYCIDPYEKYPEIDYELLKNAENIFNQMSKNYKNIIQIKKRSCDASQDFPDGFFDFVYIDGAHDYKNVKKDLDSWLPKIKSNGLIGGHDYTNKDVHRCLATCKNISIITTYEDTSWIAKII